MDWTRKELKENAKTLLKNIYWKAVLVALILSVVSGGSSGAASSSRSTSGLSESDKQEVEEAIENLVESFTGIDLDETDDYNDYDYDLDDMSYSKNDISVMNVSDYSDGLAAIWIIVGMVIGLVVIAMLIGCALSILIFKPLQVGCKKFFANADRGTEDLADIGSSFKSGVWGNTVKVMFLQSLYISLWTLLFIVPGIIKAYEYMMVPYILADHPDWTSAEIFAKSKEMMTGNKWNAFVLGLSFIGWRILAVITLGLLNIFYVNPYYDLTEAQLYATLKYTYDNEAVDVAYAYES